MSGIEVELGYFALSELQSIRGKFGLPVERDLYFQPTRLSGHPFNAGHLQYDSGMQNARYERSALRSLKPLWHMGVPPYVDAREPQLNATNHLKS